MYVRTSSIRTFSMAPWTFAKFILKNSWQMRKGIPLFLHRSLNIFCLLMSIISCVPVSSDVHVITFLMQAKPFPNSWSNLDLSESLLWFSKSWRSLAGGSLFLLIKLSVPISLISWGDKSFLALLLLIGLYGPTNVKAKPTLDASLKLSNNAFN